MKTKNVLFVLVCTLLSVHVKAANGDIFTANTSEGVTMTFKIISEVDRTVQVGSGSGVCCSTQGSVTIPETVTYSGVVYSVISIGDWAFAYANVRKITIPNSITSIGTMAFDQCVFLTSITIPSSVTSIGQNAFGLCSSLSSVTSEIETPFTFDIGAFSGISSYCKLTVPYGKKSAYIAAGWTEDVFKGGIEEMPAPIITFADANVKAICVANWDTNGDGELSEDETASVNNLGTVFRNNKEITSFDELQYFTGVISISNRTFSGCSNLISVIFPNGIETIGDYAFFGCKSLNSLTFPNSITSIGNYAFEECHSIQTLVIPTSVTSIGISAFGYCDELTSIKVEEGNLIYDSRDNCNAIIQKETNTLITGCLNTIIPTTVRCIGQAAFRGCSGLTTMSIPSNIHEIGGSAFMGCVNLETLVLSTTTNSIGGNAFWDCNNLVSVVSKRVNPVVLNSMSNTFSISYDYPNSLRRVLTVPYGTKSAYIAAGWTEEIFKGGIIEAPSPNISFADINVKAICVTNWDTNGDDELSEAEAAAVTDIGTTFTYNKQIASFNELQYFINLTSIGNNAFYACEGLTSIIIPDDVTSIGDGAFFLCDNLSTVNIPNKIESIGQSAFYSCPGVISVTIPKTLTEIGTSAFSGCFNLTSIMVESGNPVYDSRNNCNAIIETAKNTLIAGCKNTTIPNSVTSIGNKAFFGCSGLTSVTIPNSVTEIGDMAFDSCSGLTSLTIPSGVISIGLEAFYGCGSLLSVTISKSVASIGIRVFESCSGLTSILVESGNTTYDSRDNCNAIIETATNTLIAGCKNTTIPNSVITIGDNSFNGHSDLTSVIIPNSVKYIGNFAFYRCKSLASMYIPESVTSIGRDAFGGCSSLTSVIIPKNVTEIGVNAFNYCI